MKKTSIQLSVAAMCAAGLLVAFVWTYVRVNTGRTELAELLLIERGGGGAERSARIVERRLIEEETFVSELLVSEDNIPAFINTLEQLGRATGAAVTTSAVSKAPTENKFVIALVAKGSFNQVMQSLNAIEYAPYALTISSSVLSRDPAGVWSADIKLSVTAPGT